MTIDTDRIAQVASFLDVEATRHQATVVYEAKDEIERLRALVADAEHLVRHVARGKGCACVEPVPAAAARNWLSKLYAALDGGSGEDA